jgi:hypothetical protein
MLCRGYEPSAFEALRDAPLLEVATSWASLGDITALSTLLYYHPFALGPHWLTVLSALPETVDPRTIAHLLPRVGDSGGHQSCTSHQQTIKVFVGVAAQWISSLCLAYIMPSIACYAHKRT